MRVVALIALLLASDATAYRLPHHKWKSGEAGEGVGDTKSVGGGPGEDGTDDAGKNIGNFWVQYDELKNAGGAKAPDGEVLGAVMKEHDSKSSYNAAAAHLLRLGRRILTDDAILKFLNNFNKDKKTESYGEGPMYDFLKEKDEKIQKKIITAARTILRRTIREKRRIAKGGEGRAATF